MRMTMKDVLQLKLINEGELITKEQDLENQMTEWISVIEMPVENFVRKNEFVLSTGIGCDQDEQLFYQFVQEIIESEAAGLGIAVGRYIKSVPNNVIELANRNQFPIVVLPWEVRFADVVQVVTAALKQEEERIVEQNKKVQQELLNIILQNGSFLDITNYLYKMIKKPILIADSRGRVKGKSKNSQSLDQNWNDYLFSSEYDALLPTVETTPLSTTPNAKQIKINETEFLQYAIQSASEIQGYLLIEALNDDYDPFIYEHTFQLLENATTAIALCFLKENTIMETEMKLRDDFVWTLAKEKMTAWDEIESRAKTLHYNLQVPYLCLIGYPENLLAIYDKKRPTTSFEHWSLTITRRLEDELFYIGNLLEMNMMYTYQRDQFIIYIEVKNDDPIETTDALFTQFHSRLDQLIPALVISWGISKTVGTHCFTESYQEAQKALDFGRRQKGIGKTYRYSDTRLNRALVALTQNSELKDITTQTIGRLLNYDEERGINLVHTFVSYSRNRGNVSQTARELNLHRQSLLYRLRKIEKLTDCSLENPEEVFLIDLCIRLWMFGNID